MQRVGMRDVLFAEMLVKFLHGDVQPFVGNQPPFVERVFMRMA